MTDTRFYSRVPGAPPRIAPGSREDELALGWRPEIFEPLQDAILFQAHNELQFHTWGDRRCCLPAGATRATLRGHLPNLQPGDVLIFEEVRGPKTGQPGDADPQHRHAVRLASVTAFTGAVPLTDPLTDEQITEIAWTAEDALPFPLCISAVLDEDAGGGFADGISVARGNVVLADHGVTVAGPPLDPSALPPEWLDFIALHGLVVTGEPLPPVPYPRLFLPREEDCACEPVRPVPFPPRYRPRLRHGPLTHAGTVMKTIFTGGQKQRVRLPFDPQGSAAAALRWAMRDVVPRITLIEENAGPPPLPWEARRHLLASAPSAREFVAEVEHDGTTYLRFGDDTNGKRPDSGALFSAIYRVGSGRAGNVGADALAHVVAADARILEARNPLPGQGGRDPETPAEVRRRAPRAFRTQQRAVTPEDYQNVAERHPQVQRAAATLRWTGSWHTVFLTVDRTAGAGLEPAFRAELREHVEPFRMAGQDLKFDAPAFVSLEIEMVVCVAPGYFRGQVRAALLEVFSSGLLPDGRRAVFHPDNFTFGQTVYLSPLYAAARSVAGVDSVEIVTFQRQGVGDPQYLLAGKMTLGRLEIARLENDPNFPEHGVLRLTLHGGH